VPIIVDFKEILIKQTQYELRVSTDENAYLYYLLTEQGTLMPSATEIMDSTVRNGSANKTSITETHANVHSNITPSTRTYIYYDSYINLSSLKSDKKYLIYMVPEDLAGNIGVIQYREFNTLVNPLPVKFTLKAEKA